MKGRTKIFFGSFYLTLVIISCITFGFLGCAKAYENTVKNAFGKTKTAIGITESGIRIFDFEISL